MLALTPQDLSISREEITFKAKVSGYITTHLTEKITVNAVAGYMNISQRTLFYLFKKHFNTTPIQYINHAKISSAILYLREGFSVTHVSDMFAFSEPSAFNRTFKKYTGVSPREYLSQNPK